ncbi:hypothetical protein [Blautia pseudococcoides]|uniref:hypothetical protein n=1 Tax=Blautia pseudococcoides TaxID=1796616 RepID=UPI0012F49218|nr:hypothetical protein [Blautia pseudococcoides]QQQ92884.1 hypothetical protein I5Q86_21970 [Blautia pseudococcoides]
MSGGGRIKGGVWISEGRRISGGRNWGRVMVMMWDCGSDIGVKKMENFLNVILD